VEISDAAAESLPYPDASFDAVVFALVLCTVADPDRALAEAGRVLRASGRLVVLEHVRGEGRLARWQDRLSPVWRRVAAGCHPNRDSRAAIERAGFTFERVEAFRAPPTWSITSPMLEAVAVPPPPPPSPPQSAERAPGGSPPPL
jgi:ubiquinone/menaquinone biosynthesis C-methylase UbiE